MSTPSQPVRARAQTIGRRKSTVQRQGVYRSEKIRKLRNARGIPNLVPSEPVRAHVVRLLDMGFTVYSIAAAAGVGSGTVRQIWCGMYPTTKIEHASRILAVTHHPVPAQTGMRVPAIGTHRRIRALRAIGWTARDIADRIGVGPKVVNGYLAYDRVLYETWLAVRDVYEELSGTPGPSSIASARSRSRGDVPPLAWADRDMDHPDSAPDLGDDTQTDEVDEVLFARILRGEHKGDIPKTERIAVLDHAVEHGWSRSRVASTLNLSIDAADQALVRHRRKLRTQDAA